MDAIRSVGGDPTDLLWEWLGAYGPHGSSFSWSQTRSKPPGYVGIEHLEEIIAEREASTPGHREKLRQIVRLGLEASDISLLRRSIQVAAAVGGAEELERLVSLSSASDEKVAADARAAAFHLRTRQRREGTSAV